MILWLLSFAHFALLATLTTRVLIREDLASSARLAWFVAIGALPGFGALLYLFLGEVYYSRKLKTQYTAIAQTLKTIPALNDQRFMAPLKDISGEHREAFRYAQTINDFSITSGNKIELLDEAGHFLAELVEAIEAAQKSINILYYIWLPDRTGLTIAQALIRAAERGIDVRVMVDELGSRRFSRSKTWKAMKRAGVKCALAMPYQSPFQIRLTNRFDLRNHRKLAIIDGELAFIGSRNCADPEFRPKKRFGPWVDIVLRMHGPVVNQIQAIFALDWIGNGQSARLSDFLFEGQPKGNAIALARATGPLHRRNASAQSFTSSIHGAQKEIIITTPYFIPDNAVVGALCTSALSGVRVVLIVPRRNDSWVVSAASRSYYRTLLRAGVEIHEYVDGMLHAKSITIDERMSIVGSSNIDMRSFDLNFENDVMIYDKALTDTLRARQQTFLERSVEVTLEEVRAYPAWRRIWHNIVGTLGPVL